MTKPMIRVNGILVPMHETEAPEYGSRYFMPCLQNGCVYFEWTNSPDDQHYLADGLVYLNPEDGAARAKAMLIWEKVE